MSTKISKSAFLENSNLNSKLVNAVTKQIGVTFKEFAENVKDYQNASYGISGFSYYSDTHAFAIKNQSLIIELLEEQADSMGVDVVEMVGGFGIFRQNKMTREDKRDLYNFLGGNKKTEQGTITNILAWFAVEHVAFELDNYIYEL